MARVLVVDDDLDLVDACRLVLEDAGYTVETLTDARQADALARTWCPDVMLLDWVLEGLTGGEVLQSLKCDPSLADLPVIVMSALEAGDVQARAAEADDFLPKPFQADTLIAHVARVCSRARHPSERPPQPSRP
jgi:two-component system phosphate regulon response regulator PhoB